MAKIIEHRDPRMFRPGLYEHYKGGEYIALNIAAHHETKELFVVYVSLKNGTISLREWATPGKDSWTDTVGYEQGGVTAKLPRFRWLGPAL